MNNYVGAIRIYVGDRITTGTQSKREALGLYTPDVSGDSVFRWSENEILGTTDEYTSGIISEIGSVSAKADWRRGGSAAISDGMSITIVNTNQFILRVQEMLNPMLFSGKLVEYIEFEGTDADADSVSETVLFTGICGDPTWTETSLIIPITNARLKRRAPIGTMLPDNSAMIPITIGEFLPGTLTGTGNLAAAEIVENIEEEFDAWSHYKYPGSSDTKKTSFPLHSYGGVLNFADTLSIGATSITVTLPAASVLSIGDTILVYNGAVNEESCVQSFTGSYQINLASPLTKLFTGSGSVAKIPGKKLNIEITESGWLTSATVPADLYITVVSGAGKGQTRKILANENANFNIAFTVDQAFGETLEPSGENQTWFKFFTKKRSYQMDSWSCKGFLTSAGAEIAANSNPAELYSYDSVYTRVPAYAINIVDSKKLIANPFLFSEGLKNIYAFTILPMASAEQYSGTNLDKWINEADDGTGEGYDSGADMRYRTMAAGVAIPLFCPSTCFRNDTFDPFGTTGSVSGSTANIIDKTYATRYGITFANTDQRSAEPTAQPFWIAMSFKPPTISDTLQFDSVFLGLRMTVFNNFASASSYDDLVTGAILQDKLRIKWKRWTGTAFKIDGGCADKFAQRVISGKTPSGTCFVDTVPDFYYSVSPSTGNENFFYNKASSPLGGCVSKITGYESLELSDIQSKAEYDTLHQIMVMIRSGAYKLLANAEFNFYEACLIFRKQVSVDKIFTPFRGRVFNDTWGARKTAANLIQNPIDVLEHVCRLQNGSEFGDTVSIGTEYSGSMKIKTSGEGSFDDTSLAPVKALKCSRQITQDSAAWTDELKSSLCKQFFLASYIDDNGYECVKYLLAKETGAETVTFSDIIGDVGEMIEPSAADVFCQPVIKYCYSPGLGAFEKTLSITNANKLAYSSAYVTGFSSSKYLGHADTDAQVLWERCSDLWKRFQSIEPMPSDLGNLVWVADYNTAVWVLDKILQWMDKRRTSFSVSYAKGRAWLVGKHVKLQLPHETHNASIECVVEEIEKSKNDGTVTVRVVLLDPIPCVFDTLVYQDSMIKTGSLQQWQDVYTKAGNTAYQEAI